MFRATANCDFSIIIIIIINNSYITITEYIRYKTYNLQHNIESTFTLLNYEFVTKQYWQNIIFITLLTYSTPLTTLDIIYLQNLA